MSIISFLGVGITILIMTIIALMKVETANKYHPNPGLPVKFRKILGLSVAFIQFSEKLIKAVKAEITPIIPKTIAIILFKLLSDPRLPLFIAFGILVTTVARAITAVTMIEVAAFLQGSHTGTLHEVSSHDV